MNRTLNNGTINEILQALSEPFHPGRITWRPGALTETKEKALAFAYADLRAYQDRLDDVCGLDWSVSYTPWGERIICHLTISGITRSSTGEADSDAERSAPNGHPAGTAAEAQAFKRACAMFGLGRYLYNLPTLWVEYDAAHNRFTDRAKARLNGAIAQHYQRFLDGQKEEVVISDDEEALPQRTTPAGTTNDKTNGSTNGTPVNGTPPNGAPSNGAHDHDLQGKVTGDDHAASNGNGRGRRVKTDKSVDKAVAPSGDETTALEASPVAEAPKQQSVPVEQVPAPQRQRVAETGAAAIDPLRQQLNKLGEELYGSQWEQVRAHNVKRLTGKPDTTAGSLTEEQLQKLIGGLEKLKQQRQVA